MAEMSFPTSIITPAGNPVSSLEPLQISPILESFKAAIHQDGHETPAPNTTQSSIKQGLPALPLTDNTSQSEELDTNIDTDPKLREDGLFEEAGLAGGGTEQRKLDAVEKPIETFAPSESTRYERGIKM